MVPACLLWVILGLVIVATVIGVALLWRRIIRLWVSLRREARAWWIVPILALLGLAVWALPSEWSADWTKYSQANRYSELGAALTGGAIIAGVVLFLERLFSVRAEDRTVKFEMSRQNDISGADLHDRNLTGSYWRSKTVRKAYLTNANLDNSVLADCDFTDAILFDVSFRGATVSEGTTFGGANLGGADFTGADLTGADLTGAFLKEGRDPLTRRRSKGGANLTGANLSGNQLLGGVLFQGADLTRTNLNGADLRGALGLSETRNRGTAKCDSTTKWPGNGDPPTGFNCT